MLDAFEPKTGKPYIPLKTNPEIKIKKEINISMNSNTYSTKLHYSIPYNERNEL